MLPVGLPIPLPKFPPKVADFSRLPLNLLPVSLAFISAWDYILTGKTTRSWSN
jgi:hypothetical protein